MFDSADQQGAVPLKLPDGIARGEVPVMTGVPAQPDDEMAGAGTLISGLRPAALPASVASSGMAASLNAAPMPGANEAGMLGLAGCAETVGLQMPDMVEVPNAGAVEVPTGGICSVPNWVVAGVPNEDATCGAKGDVTSGTNGIVVDVVPVMPGKAPAIWLAGQPAMAPIAPPCGWPRLPRLS
jgi:hypothetical protein